MDGRLTRPVRSIEDHIAHIERKLRIHCACILLGLVAGIAVTWLRVEGITLHYLVPAGLTGLPVGQEILDKVLTL